MRNDETLEKMKTKNDRKRKMKFQWHVKKALSLTGHIIGKSDSGKQRVFFLKSLWKSLSEEGLTDIEDRQSLLRAPNDRKLWSSMIADVFKGKDTCGSVAISISGFIFYVIFLMLIIYTCRKLRI